MLPAPTLTFTIPSIYDDTVLDCRVYFPPHFLTSLPEKPWRKKTAIIAHPYAPLGGCYDAPVVKTMALQLLYEDFVVGTFNFRGAGNSKGRTTWTSKGETEDYMSMIGLMLYLINGLSRPHDPLEIDEPIVSKQPDFSPLATVPSHALPPPYPDRHASSASHNGANASGEDCQQNSNTAPSEADSKSLLLLAGYSYGSLITRQLPDLESIKTIFKTPINGSAAAEIRLRAQQLAKQQNETFLKLKSIAKPKPGIAGSETINGYKRGRTIQVNDLSSSRNAITPSGVRVGGEETDGSVRRASHDSHRRSFQFEAQDRVRKSLDRVRSVSGRLPSEKKSGFSRRQTSSPEKKHSGSFTSSSSAERKHDTRPVVAEEAKKLPIIELGEIKVAYLLVSTLTGLITSFATMWCFNQEGKNKRRNSEPGVDCHEELKLIENDTLAVFGDQDVFVSAKKLRAWAYKLANNVPGSKFRYVEVGGAGHFWLEMGVLGKLEGAVREFGKGL